MGFFLSVIPRCALDSVFRRLKKSIQEAISIFFWNVFQSFCRTKQSGVLQSFVDVSWATETSRTEGIHYYSCHYAMSFRLNSSVRILYDSDAHLVYAKIRCS